VPEGDFQKQSVVVELVVSTGTQAEVVFLSVNLQRFSAEVPQQVLVLPATGIETSGTQGEFVRVLAGAAALFFGLVVLALGRRRRA
jgi:hypothetical protein